MYFTEMSLEEIRVELSQLKERRKGAQNAIRFNENLVKEYDEGIERLTTLEQRWMIKLDYINQMEKAFGRDIHDENDHRALTFFSLLEDVRCDRQTDGDFVVSKLKGKIIDRIFNF